MGVSSPRILMACMRSLPSSICKESNVKGDKGMLALLGCHSEAVLTARYEGDLHMSDQLPLAWLAAPQAVEIDEGGRALLKDDAIQVSSAVARRRALPSLALKV